MEAKLIAIGNSRGIRIPQKMIQKYDIQNSLELIESTAGLLLKPIHDKNSKMSWEDTYKDMKNEKESWAHFDNALMDGLHDL